MQALQGWVAGGGRLVIVGGTTGPNTLSAFPDTFLPYRPSATVDVAASALGGLVGAVPASAPDLTALGGALTEGRTLLTSGDRVIAAERPTGQRLRHGRRVRPDRQVAGRRHRGGEPVAAHPAGSVRVRAGALRRQPARRRGLAAPVARAAADRRPDRAPDRLHRADRPDQLPRAPPPRPPRMGVGDDARAHRGLRGRRLRVRGRAARQRRPRQRGRPRSRLAGCHRRDRAGLRRRLLARHAGRTR